MLQRTMLQRTNATTNGFYQYIQDATMNTDATTNECYNERMLQRPMLQRTVFINKIRMLQRTQMLQRIMLQRKMLQRTVFINKIRMLQRTQMLQRMNATTKECYNERFLSINIRMLQRTQMLQRMNATTNSFYQ